MGVATVRKVCCRGVNPVVMTRGTQVHQPRPATMLPTSPTPPARRMRDVGVHGRRHYVIAAALADGIGWVPVVGLATLIFPNAPDLSGCSGLIGMLGLGRPIMIARIMGVKKQQRRKS